VFGTIKNANKRMLRILKFDYLGSEGFVSVKRVGVFEWTFSAVLESCLNGGFWFSCCEV
jgi:hypothetical protein